MFTKLLSSLPFNPGMIDQVAQYAKQLNKELSVRRLGLFVVLLGTGLQIFAALSPPKPTLSLSNNDIIRGGISSQQEARTLCISNTSDFSTILKYYKISCDNLSQGQIEQLRSTDYNRHLYSLGRLPYGKEGETMVAIPGLGNFYMRPLWSWDIHSRPSSYTALRGTRDDQTPFMIILAGGNVIIDNPQAKVDAMSPLIKSKTVRNNTKNIQDANGTKAQSGDNIVYTLSVKNSGTEIVNSFVMEEDISDILEYVDSDNLDLRGGLKDHKNIVRWPAVNIRPGETIHQEFSVTIKDNIPQTPVSTSDPGSHDLKLTNVYGNTVTIALPSSLIKTTEKLALTLPHTDSSGGLLISFCLTLFSAYLCIRNRLVLKELDLVRLEYATDGGQ